MKLNKGLIIHVSEHVLLSLILAAVAFYLTGSLIISVSIFVFGVFMDADHLFDYLLYLKHLGSKSKNTLMYMLNHLSISDFLAGGHFNKSNKVYVPLHSYELIVFLVILGFFNPVTPWIGLSMLLHILFDQYTYPMRIFTYSIMYRHSVKYESSMMCV